MSVTARIEPRSIPTYPMGAPEKNPVFFEKRVYQGSNGKVYPVPFIDKVHDEPEDVIYQSALLENEFVRLVILPEIGGRIFIGQDKTNNDYDFFYRQDVIKPALVGLAGPWISGGVEFNWPQHHRPGTFLPADVHIEEEDDGARTIWMSEHDPLNRLKGMHGIRLRPGSSVVELRARLYNRTPFCQTFLWWANVAAEVHDQYQSFFPADVHYVADHAVRASSSFPIADKPYYGIQYQDRPGENDLSWYKNITVPTSYMVCQTNYDFFGGYDFSKNGGFVHVANRHIAPGKKQWTWGNDEFGWAWDRELTDKGGPYVELMAGVFTDNQPDFSYLQPYETKTFSQFWWPIQDIGPVQQANTEAAFACKFHDDGKLALGICVSEKIEDAVLLILHQGKTLAEHDITLSPGESWINEDSPLNGEKATDIQFLLIGADGRELISYQPVDRDSLSRDREVATEPPAPEDITSNDELYFTGEHLEQYRHPTRSPETYWQEAIKRDPGDARCNTALGKRSLNRGEFEKAADYFEKAIGRFTSRHPNPVTGEAHYHLGLALRWLGDTERAYSHLYKATWNYEWRSCANYQLATMDCARNDWDSAFTHLNASLETNLDHNKAQVLQAIVLRIVEDEDEARSVLDSLLEIDPLDHWARWEKAKLDNTTNEFLTITRNDAQTILDLVFDYCEAELFDDAIDLLEFHLAHEVTAVAVPNPLERTPMSRYTLAFLKAMTGHADATEALTAARNQSPDHFFPSRLEEMMILQGSLAQDGGDPVAAYGLGNFLFDKRRHEDAIAAWEAAGDTDIPQVHRNLGIAYWNHEHDGEKASASYCRALELDSSDPRLVSEHDQLSKKRNLPLAERLKFLESHRAQVLERDDATVELATLYNLSGRPQEALNLVKSRRFHPWEGGEGAVLLQYTTARLLLGRDALDAGDATRAHEHFTLAMDTPESLGEAYHPLQAKADVNYWIGRSLGALGDSKGATEHFRQSAEEAGDFADMAVIEHSPLSYYRGLSLRELGKSKEAETLFLSLLDFGMKALETTATIDYFATSLPNLLVFDEDLQARRDAENHLLIAFAHHGLNNDVSAKASLRQTLAFDLADQHAANLTLDLDDRNSERLRLTTNPA